MASIKAENRSYDRIQLADLECLREIAKIDRTDFFRRLPRYRSFERNLICTCLCQGAALHFIDGTTGVKDFDVWSFYRAQDSGPLPRRRVARPWPRDGFADSEKRVDLILKEIPDREDVKGIDSLQAWLKQGWGRAHHLRKKAVVVLEPRERLGEVVWPMG